MSSGSARCNMLAGEKSPYLRLHAGDPVHWYPWGDEAFRAAREEDKPIFLSIGYATCHWCHVMARDSFSNEEVADLLNHNFVCIKVDREERPDVDLVFMTVCQMLVASGGWPLTIILTPEGKPFFATTFVARDSRFGRVGLKDLAVRIGQMWKADREKIVESAERITEALESGLRSAPPAEAGAVAMPDSLDKAYHAYASAFDRANGGFVPAPKFPTPHVMMFLLRYWKRTGKDLALDMVTQTLGSMRRGGVYDQIGFGFHRYSTDDLWRVPHFEKMLYDQAMHIRACLEAWRATGRHEFAETARETIAYVLRDLTSPDGAFYSAEDADSEGVEGKFYLWSLEEVVDVLGPAEGALAAEVWGLSEEGNYQDESTGRENGLNIPHLATPIAEVAARLDLSEEEITHRLDRAREKLFEVRGRRERPLRDEKTLADWNGLMIASLAYAARTLSDSSYLRAAERAADFVFSRMADGRGRLLHRWAEGEAAIPGKLDDYAFMLWGLLELYGAGFDARHLARARELADELARFRDDAGGFFLTADDDEALLVRPKEMFDGAYPSGNAAVALALRMLGRLLGEPDFEREADRVEEAAHVTLDESPQSHAFLLMSTDLRLGPSRQVVIAGDSGAADTAALISEAGAGFRPGVMTILRPTDDGADALSVMPDLADYDALDGRAAAYVCREEVCVEPVSDAAELARLLD